MVLLNILMKLFGVWALHAIVFYEMQDSTRFADDKSTCLEFEQRPSSMISLASLFYLSSLSPLIHGYLPRREQTESR